MCRVHRLYFGNCWPGVQANRDPRQFRELIISSAQRELTKVVKYPGASALVFWLVLTLTASPLWANNEVPPANKITLTSSTSLSSEGYFVLSWESEPWESEPLESKASQDTSNISNSLLLLQASNAEMHIPEIREVQGSGAITLSGLSDGKYFFKLVSSENLNTDTNTLSGTDISTTARSSNVVQVDVKHHSLHKAFVFFTVGLILLIVLCLSIFIGNKFHKRDHS